MYCELSRKSVYIMQKNYFCEDYLGAHAISHLAVDVKSMVVLKLTTSAHEAMPKTLLPERVQHSFNRWPLQLELRVQS